MSPPTREVSVVLSAFNAELYLAASVESILRQRDVDLELIIIDDGSTDATSSIALQYAGDSRVRILRQSNVGLTTSLLRGCAVAHGTYLARQDAGDLSEPSRLAAQVSLLRKDPRLSFVSCWTRVVGPALEELWIEKGGVPADHPLDIIDPMREWGVAGGPSHHGSVMMRRDVYERVGGYRPQFRYGQDWDLWYRLAEQGLFAMVGEVLYNARVTIGGISSVARDAQRRLSLLSLQAHRARKNGGDEQAVLDAASRVVAEKRASSAADTLYFVGEALRRRGDHRARGYLLNALRCRPFSLRTWVRLAQSIVSR